MKRTKSSTERNDLGMQSNKNNREDRSVKKETDGTGLLLKGSVVIAIFIMLVALVMEFVGCESVKTILSKPIYEYGTPGYEPDTDLEASFARLNLPVLPDYIITESKPDIMIPYPKQNVYDIEFSFKKQGSKKVLYRTNRITPGLTVSIPAYDFIKKSGTYVVEVNAYDHDTFEDVESSVVLEANITKK